MMVALCVIVRNEAPSIAEHLTYHHLVGFHTAILLDHCSTDGSAAIAAALPFDVRVHPWRGSSQLAAYQAVCDLYAHEFDWIAFVDADEFLVLDGAGLHAWLQRFVNAEAIAVPWLMYGSNGHDRAPAGLTVEAFTRRAPDEHVSNRHCKALVRPGCVREWPNPHMALVRGRTVLPDGAPPAWDFAPGVLARNVPPGCVRMHHYYVRSREHWARRIARGQFDAPPKTWAQFDQMDRNDVEDRTAARIGPLLRQRLQAVAA